MAMRVTKKQQTLLPQIRELVVLLGLPMSEACAKVGISRTTGADWRKKDEAATGKHWDDLRRARLGSSPFELIAILEERLDKLIRAKAIDIADRYIDQMIRTCQDNIKTLKERLCDTLITMEALQVFSSWAARRYRSEPEKFDIVGAAIMACVDDLREDRFGLEATG